jgi:K+-sensing histidine kinase KdpD
VWLKSNDVVKAMLDYARDNGITRIIVGRTHRPWWSRVIRGDVPMRLLKAAVDIDVDIVADDQGEAPR